jgi:radical SAM protein with 4Fe4S-binding SPASM domain
MTRRDVTFRDIQNHPLWGALEKKRIPLTFDLELTARCNHRCRHCYINLPADDENAKDGELSVAEISHLADQAVALGAVWCLLTGGEPLLREDFAEIYMALKRKGLLISLFSNAALIDEGHVRLFKAYPPRDIEVTVYGVTRETYERVTRQPGSFAAFRRGLDRLWDGGIKVRLKAMAVRANVSELAAIARFCRERTKDSFRFDPLLHLRFDGDERRNAEICAERLSPDEIVAIERADRERAFALRKECETLLGPALDPAGGDRLFHCGVGRSSFCVSSNGLFRLCSDLWHPECLYDLRKGSLADAWRNFTPRVWEMRTNLEAHPPACHSCPMVDLCFWCPARAYLETGRMGGNTEYFCRVARARAAVFGPRGPAALPGQGAE